ncbi:MAG: DUF475 domain-containing protein [Candidatus Paceibacterota bacterium]
MAILEIILTVLGLCVFEVVSSVDNAIVNAGVLKTMAPKFRKIFLVWGMLFAVVIVRGILPFLLVWLSSPSLNFPQVFSAVFSGDETVKQSLDTSKPLLLLGGGAYLFLVFLSWLFLEEKNFLLKTEKFIKKQGVWFYAIASLFTTFIIFLALKENPILALAASVGISAFFITDGFKKNAEETEKELISEHLSAWSKILYLEILDASFSIDGVIGAFAFTMSVPLIIIGNGLGAFVVRDLTIRGLRFVEKFAYLKNGAMYSIGFLGVIMLMESFGHEFPFWVAPLVTISILIVVFIASMNENKRNGAKD